MQNLLDGFIGEADQIVGVESVMQFLPISLRICGFSIFQHSWSLSILKASQSSPSSFKHKDEHVNLSIGLEDNFFCCKSDVIVSGLMNFF